MNMKSGNIKPGFTLIELLIATALASVLSISLFLSYGQTNKVVVFINDYVDTFNAVILIDQQFSKDVSGAFIPVQAVRQKKDKDAKKADQPKPDDKNKKENEVKQVDAKQSEKNENKVPLLKDPFISKNRDKNMQMFSFITNNPIRVYWGKKSGGPKTSIARVVYTLEEDKTAPKDKPRFILYRQEGSDLSLASYIKKDSQIERYVIADNIKACSISFIVTEDKDDSKDIKEFFDWQPGKDEKDLRSKVKLPEQVKLTITLWNVNQSRDKEFVITVPIAAKFNELPVQEPLKAKAPSSEAAKGGATQKQAPAERKELLASSANKVVDSIRGLFKA